MPWLDATTPADAALAGDGNTDIKALETELNTLDGVVGDFSGAIGPGTDKCILGWPRVGIGTDAGKPAAAAPGGRIYVATNTGIVYYETVAGAWARVPGPAIDYRIPLSWGIAHDFTAVAWDDKDPAYQLAGVTTVKPWKAGEGYLFNKAEVPTGATIKFTAAGARVAGTQLEVRLYDVAAAAAIAGSALTFTDVEVEVKLSADLTAAITAGDRRFRIQVLTTGGTCVLFYAELRIEKT